SARAVLADPEVDLAVFELARGGLLRGGLAYDWSDIAVLTNIQADHIGQDNIESLNDVLKIKSLVAERVRSGGTVILNADDDLLRALAEEDRMKRRSREIVFISLHGESPFIRAHVESGGAAYVLEHGMLVEYRGGRRRAFMHASKAPQSADG